MYDLYSSDDKRKNVTIGVSNNKLYAKKYVGPTVKDQDSDINVIVLRYADVVLMLAEALNEIGYTGDQDSDINVIVLRYADVVLLQYTFARRSIYL